MRMSVCRKTQAHIVIALDSAMDSPKHTDIVAKELQKRLELLCIPEIRWGAADDLCDQEGRCQLVTQWLFGSP